MAEATVTTESGYLEMFAAFFVGASEAKAHYYYIKPLQPRQTYWCITRQLPGIASGQWSW
jgi:hypothetical protein